MCRIVRGLLAAVLRPSPECDQQAVLRVERIVLGNAVPAVEAIFVGERSRLQSPVLLERERSRAALAPAKVEAAQATLAGSAQQLPVLEIVGGQIACRLDLAGVIRQHFVAEVETEHARDRLAARLGHRKDLAIAIESAPQRLEVTLRERRRPRPASAADAPAPWRASAR